jgi:hypothetical protein
MKGCDEQYESEDCWSCRYYRSTILSLDCNKEHASSLGSFSIIINFPASLKEIKRCITTCKDT